ncbi:transcriptional regulator [Desulfosporosinus orientis DSM 765]|uniref:Transcriptional regulator n=1 Tax=Desulfosporosinus orientis (strain ATCC 19365 / DSM 765 / NCIMB 8382 / VKM B-1628 / Singapore I) TaxID=768706 RepID=G7W8N0_DESOD|nr:TetR/AcrR family transcriptional regulator [Desulfosporosinus orientis]AET67457.1 transcriptional regulator [Desulfosporosinus orientis DSM 765]
MGDAKIPNRMEKKKKQTRIKIIEVAMSLFEKQGFSQTTMEQIADVADVAKGTLYNHFSCKEAIVSAYVQTVNNQTIPVLKDLLSDLPNTRSRLLKVLLQVFDWGKLNRELVMIYFSFRMQNLVKGLPEPGERSGFAEILAMIFRQGQLDGELREGVSAEYLANYFNMIYFRILIEWLSLPDKYPLQEQLATNIDLFLNGVKR